MAPRTQRDYSGVIAESPVRHALFNKPFSSLRRRTESLLDNITGATTAEEILEAERRGKEQIRALTCRFCRVVYADDFALQKHYNMFPAHLVQERPRRKSREPSQSSIKTESPRVPPSVTDRQAMMQHSRAQSSPNLYATRERDAVPSSRPTPASPPMPSKPSLPSTPTYRSDNVTPQRSVPSSPQVLTSSEYASPPRQAAPVPPRNAYVANPIEADARYASDFYSQSASVGANNGYGAMYDPSYGSSPYALPNAMFMPPGGTQPMQNHHNVPLSQWQPHQAPAAPPPRAAAMLPNFDFESRFRQITLNGVHSPPSAQAHSVTYSPDKYERAASERNREAGARSVARLTPSYTGTAIQEEPSEEDHYDEDPRKNRALRRGATDSQLVVTATNSGGVVPAMPNTLGGVVRAVVATAATGPRGQPVMPAQSSPVRQKLPSAAWVPLSDDGDDLDGQEKGDAKPKANAFLKHTRGMSSSSSGRPWGALLEGLPGSPQEEKRAAVKELPAVGSTSFSDNAVVEGTGGGGGVESVKRERRNTNPFLNRDFMRGLPNALKTPPLTPTSPWSMNGGLSSPSNPFQQLSGDDEAVLDGENDEVAFFDANDDARRSPTKSKTFPGAFFDERS